MARSSKARTDEYRALFDRQRGPLFHQPWWLDAVCDDWMGIVVHGKDATGIWPVPLERKLGVRISRNPMLTPYLGPYVVDVGSTPLPPATEDVILRDMLRALPDIPVWHTAARPLEWRTSAFDSAGFQTGHRPTYLLPLADRSAEEVFAQFHAEVRRAVKRASEAAITITDDPGAAAEMYRLQDATLRRKGTRLYYPVEKFERLVKLVADRGDGALWTARRGGEIIGAQWSTWDAQWCYNIGLARVDGDQGRHVAAALLWHAIRHAHSLGLEVFDFEGSSVPGIAQFFARFGGSIQPYLTLHKNTSLIWRAVRRLRG